VPRRIPDVVNDVTKFVAELDVTIQNSTPDDILKDIKEIGKALQVEKQVMTDLRELLQYLGTLYTGAQS
jgi:hypothetical protein